MLLHLPKFKAWGRKFHLLMFFVISIPLLLVSNGVKAQEPVSGTFTINSALPSSETNFQTFTEAVFSLAYGVNGPVIFNVAPGSGPYVEQINISAVPGASATNTITFNGNGATLENTSTNPLARAVMKLDGARHIILNNIVFHAINTATPGSYGWGVGIVRNADSNTVKNCTINIDVSNSNNAQNTIGIYVGSSDDFPDNNGISDCDYNIIDNNTINGGYDGIDLNNYAGNYGFDFTSMDFNQVTNNKISGFVHSGIHIIWNKSTLVKGNDISVNAIQSVHGIYAEEKNSNLKIDANRIHNFTSDPAAPDNNFIGIEVTYCVASATTKNTVSNNLIYDIQTVKDQEGITLTNSSYVDVYNNTVVLDGTVAGSGATNGLKYDGPTFNINFKNNIINVARQGVSGGYGVYVTAATTAFVSDYNNIYVAAPHNFGRNVSTTYNTLALWQTATSRDIHSTSQDPLFTDLAGGNLKPTSVPMDNLGTFAGITTDFNGDIRNNNTPDIGAYEFLTPPCNTPVAPGTATGIPGAPACSGIARTLNLNGNSFGSGQTYQWQSSPTINGTYTNVGGSQVVPLLDITPTTDLYYRAVVACGPSVENSVPVLISVRHELSGTYTINSAAPTDATNFNSFGDVVASLNCGGITGPVVLNVVAGSGPYNEQVVLGAIPGTSATNRITINGNGETLTYLALDANQRATLKLTGTKYVTIDNLTITSTGSASSQYGFGVQLLNDADYNIIKNSRININTTSTSPNFTGIAIGGLDADPVTSVESKCDFNLIENNVITGGYYGVIYSSDPALVRMSNDTLRNNVIKEQHAYGIYVKGTDRLSIEGNDVSRPLRTTVASTYYGIYLNGISTALTVAKNKVHDSHNAMPTGTDTPIAIASNNCDATSAAINTISNNVIYNFGALGSLVGIQNTGSDHTVYLHNTVSFDRKIGEPTIARTTRAFYQTTAAVGLVYRNNNVTITRSGLGTNTAIYMNTNTTAFVASNNNYYVAGTGVNKVGFKNAIAYTTIDDWKNGSANDANSVSIDPAYADLATGNLSPTNLALDNLGINTSITTDINGFARSATTPDLGAYEFTGALPVKLLGFSANKVAGNVLLKWITASELNTKHFVVERSTDAVSFAPIGTVQARGNSNVNQNYNFTDVDAVSVSARILYYRLKIVDNDGKVEYSAVLSVLLGNEEKISVNVQPNPFMSELFSKIITNKAGKANIRLTDVSGRVILRQTVEVVAGTNLIRIEKVGGLPQGTYFVNIELNNSNYVQKVIR